MPYISLKTTPGFDNQTKAAAAKEITENMAIILSKPVDSIMLDMQATDNLFLGGTQMWKGAYVEISVFGKASPEAKEQANTFLCDYLQDKLGIEAKDIYVSYFDKSEWGYRGNYISK